MKITEIDNVMDYIKYSIPIGIGTTAICFLMPDGRVFKYYIDTPNTYALFQSDMIERLSNINKVMNDTYIGPEEVLVMHKKVVGYLYPFVKARTLKHMKKSNTIDELFGRADKLIKDTIDISNKGFMLFDVHWKNILYDGNYYVIDLDKGHLVESRERLLSHNLNQIYQTIFETIFKIKPWEVIDFNDRRLTDMYYKNKWDNEDSLNEFLDYIKFKTNDSNPSIRVIRSRIGYTKFRNSYYK